MDEKNKILYDKLIEKSLDSFFIAKKHIIDQHLRIR